jgi:hypothetical protein
MSREATKRLYDLMEQGLITADEVVDMCTDAMSEDDVAKMLDNNELSERFFEDEDDDFEEDEPDVDEAQEWADFDPEC